MGTIKDTAHSGLADWGIPGTYVFDSLSLSGSSQLVITGATTIYVTGANNGTLNLSGGTVLNTTTDSGPSS